MIESRKKNQAMLRNAIADYQNQYSTTNNRVADLFRFSRFLAQRMLKRAEDQDCYLTDMLEDLERL